MNHVTGSTALHDRGASEGPATPVLALSFLLAGLGTVLLGPLLPQLMREWSLSDQRAGLLLLAKFVGAFGGGVAVPRRLRMGILAGHGLTAIGLGAFTLCHGLGSALPALLLSGFGLGEIIASTNILAGRRWPAHAGSALALLNLLWSLGAVSTGILAGALLPHVGWRKPTFILAILFLLVGVGGVLVPRATGRETAVLSQLRAEALRTPLALRFAGLLFLYGGLETCLTAWLTTFALRFAGGALLGGQSGFVVLWAALTGGRALASAALRRWSEVAVQRVSLVCCFGMVGLLAASRSAATLSIACVLLGLALAPVFPSTFGLLMQHGPSARLAGALLAVSGLGAAFFPWLMGAVSTHAGSLRWAMMVPALLVPAMLLLTRGETEKADLISTEVARSGAKIR